MGAMAELIDLVNGVQQAELKNQLMGKITALQTQLLDQQDKLFQLQKDNHELRAASDLAVQIENLKSEFTFKGGAYRRGGDPPGVGYCSGCLEKRGDVITLARVRGSIRTCPVCKAQFVGVAV